MEVVLMLAGAESGHINWVVIVLGNLFVCGFEGLIVGIQVLRLERLVPTGRLLAGRIIDASFHGRSQGKR